ncbi:MAG: type I glutamate--ammonia ligase [Myxococcales bacterium]|nr:type I glutamate--ammonia ligase [Myxococcales bacterium]
MDAKSVAKILENEKAQFLRLQFTDINGLNKAVEVPAPQFGKALSGNILFDGSSLEGTARETEEDMLLQPDYSTLKVLASEDSIGPIARLICDIKNPDGSPSPSCPRSVLRRVNDEFAKLGFETNCGPEVEFFLFHRSPDGAPTIRSFDPGGYFDQAPIDRGELVRRRIIDELVKLEISVEASHHEVARGQHEVDFRHTDALRTADNLATFKFIARRVAADYNLHATFMPKPLYGVSGSGLHMHLSVSRKGTNAFFDTKGEHELSDTARYFIAGLLEHARGITAITNPLVNSYKRLVRGYEAPTHVAWSARNQSPLCRVPARRGESTRVEYRAPDPSCNPYLALAVILASGLDGLKEKLELGPPVNKNIFRMSARERGRLRVGELPANLDEALHFMEKDRLVRQTLGDTIYFHFLQAKEREWEDYISQVHSWEIDRYLTSY